MTLSEFREQGDRTFFDGEWFYLSDKDGNPRGPYRHPLLYLIRYVTYLITDQMYMQVSWVDLSMVLRVYENEIYLIKELIQQKQQNQHSLSNVLFEIISDKV